MTAKPVSKAEMKRRRQVSRLFLDAIQRELLKPTRKAKKR